MTFSLSEDGGRRRLSLVHSGLRRGEDAISFDGGWHSHLAALEKRINEEGVPDLWALHPVAESEMGKALG